MNDVIGIAWFKDEATYRRALAIFTDSENMPDAFEDWKALVKREREEFKGAGRTYVSEVHSSSTGLRRYRHIERLAERNELQQCRFILRNVTGG